MSHQASHPSLRFLRGRQSLRLSTHDYTWTRAYFVTIRVKSHEPLFDIPALSMILQQTWEALPQRFPSITLDEYVIMPDHVHFIVWLHGLAEHAPPLGHVVRAYTSLTTVAWLRHMATARLECAGRFWQRNYYERVIRDTDELEKIRRYIRENPQQLQNLR